MKYLDKARSFISRTMLIIISLVICSDLVMAGNGKITGRVTDGQTHEPLPAVNVVITHSVVKDGVEVPLSRTLGAATDIDGYFFIMDVPPGVYTISASLIGYGTTIQKLVKVDLDRTITLNFEISSASIQTEQVVVTAKREIIKADVAATQEVISTARIEQMPVTRVDEFLGKIKGVELVSNSEGNGLSVRGGSIRETDVRLDGMSLQDPRSGNSYLAFNSTTIQEMQVLTGGFEAKYGGVQSGLLNVVTKEGQRERYTASVRVDVAPANQRRYFGTNPWSEDSWVYKIHTGEFAFNGIQTRADSMAVPSDFWSWKGWNSYKKAKKPIEIAALSDSQIVDLWKKQHPMYSYGTKPDYFIEGSITGPVPGSFIPLWGDYAEKSTFLLGFKYEDSQFAFPIGGRDSYKDWNGQLKLTTVFPDGMKLSVNGLYAKTSTLSGGSATSYGGALSDVASSFGFLNSTESSVISQAKLINGDNLSQIFNKSRLQFFDQKYIVAGSKFTHTLSSKAFYTLEFNMGYTDQMLQPFRMDTTGGANTISFYSTKAKRTFTYLVPDYGSLNASTNYAYDPLLEYRIFGGTQRIDSSYTYTYQLKGDITAQLGRHNQLEAGFLAKLEDFFMYSGTWYQSQLSYTPDTWQYVKSHPLQMGLYVQDKMEFEGLILNAGLRLDYLNPFKKGYQVEFPLADAYAQLINDIYNNLPGASGSYERWSNFRDLLENPPGWPQTENKVQAYISPRLGVSFPITEASKMYFNYGHFYQRAQTQFLYDLYAVQGSVTVPTPGLKMEKTVSYEFGYEQMFLSDFVLNVTAYYKDISNRPMARTYKNYYGDNIVTEYFPDGYKDVRGVELRLEKPVGRFVSFNAMYDYMVTSSGQSGLEKIYENKLESRDEMRKASQDNPIPKPRANVNLNIHTPSDFGPEFLGINWLGSIYTNLFFEWRAGDRFVINSSEPDMKNWIWVDKVNTWNIDLRASKAFNTEYGSIEFVVTIKNLTNNKWLNTDNMTPAQLSEYKNSLHTADKGGSDKWGEYDKDYIKTGWYEAPIFLNPRRIILGLRLNL